MKAESAANTRYGQLKSEKWDAFEGLVSELPSDLQVALRQHVIGKGAQELRSLGQEEEAKALEHSIRTSPSRQVQVKVEEDDSGYETSSTRGDREAYRSGGSEETMRKSRQGHSAYPGSEEDGEDVPKEEERARREEGYRGSRMSPRRSWLRESDASRGPTGTPGSPPDSESEDSGYDSGSSNDVKVISVSIPQGWRPVGKPLRLKQGEWDNLEEEILRTNVQYWNNTKGRYETTKEAAKRIVVYNWLVHSLKGGEAFQFIVGASTRGYVAEIYENVKDWVGQTTAVSLSAKFNQLSLKVRKFTSLGELLFELEDEAKRLNNLAMRINDRERIYPGRIRHQIVNAAIAQYGKMAEKAITKLEENNVDFTSRDVIEKLQKKVLRH